MVSVRSKSGDLQTDIYFGRGFDTADRSVHNNEIRISKFEIRNKSEILGLHAQVSVFTYWYCQCYQAPDN